MRLSLLDWLDADDDDSETSDVPSQIDLTRDIERGWPIHPADGEALTFSLVPGAFPSIFRQLGLGGHDASNISEPGPLQNLEGSRIG